MQTEFDAERFDLLDVERVHVPSAENGALDVWKSLGETGTTFVRQTTVDGTAGPTRHSVSGTACYFLREKASDRFFFLERTARGYSLHDETFVGATTYHGPEATSVASWLKDRAPIRPAGVSRAPQALSASTRA